MRCVESTTFSFVNNGVLSGVGKYSSFKIYKPQAQGTSLYTWDVVCKELCSNYRNSLGHLKLDKSKGEKEVN